MPHYLIPRKSGVHRAACFALYRALLRAVRSSLPPQQPTACTRPCSPNHQLHGHRSPNGLRITAAFHRNSQLQAPQAIITQLQRGYDIIGALRAGAVPEDDASIGPTTYKRPKSACKPPPKQRPAGNKPLHLPDKHSILSRPLPLSQLSGSGVRRVPILASGNGIPFLRIKKPQPPVLSMRIRAMIKWREKRWDNIKFLEKHLATVAEGEDNWEKVLRAEFEGEKKRLAAEDMVERDDYLDGEVLGPSGTKRKKPKYRMVKFVDAVQQGLREEKQKLETWTRKQREHAVKLQEVVNRERVLKAEETQKSRAAAKARRVAARRLRREAAGNKSSEKQPGN